MSDFNVNEFIIESLTEYGTYFNEERAIPSIFDGCKPSQRKILYSAHVLGLKPTGKFRKVVNLIGETTKIYLHGPASLEEAIVRMGQPHKMTYPLLSGNGNWGGQAALSMKKSGAAAPRYIECRISPLGGALLESLKNGTAKMKRNFDNTMDEPEHLFIPIPVFLLFNQLGIGVGTATSIPSFRLSSVIDATQALMKDKAISEKDFAKILQPYYSQEATIVNKSELPVVYSHVPRDNKNKSIKFRATFQIKGNELIITNFPYSSSPDLVVSQIEKALEVTPIFNSISKVQDTSSLENRKEKVSMSIEFKPKTDVEDLIQTLCEKTSLESSVSVNLVLLDAEGHAKEYSVRTALLAWIEIYLRKTKEKLEHEKRGLEEKGHILKGLIKALDEIDEIIRLIKSSESKSAAMAKIETRGYSTPQAKAILDMKLVKLANLEYQELLNNLKTIQEEVAALTLILSNPVRLVEYSTILMNSYRSQELYSTPMKEVDELFAKRNKIKEIKVTYAKLDRGNVKYGGSKGKGDWKEVSKENPAYAISKETLIPIKEEVFARDVDLLLQEELDSYDIITVNKEGKIKRTAGSIIKASKPVALTSQKDVVTSLLCKESDYVVIKTKNGYNNIFSVSEVNPTGRGALGVIGIKLDPSDNVVSIEITDSPKWVGKRAHKGRKLK